MGKFCGRCGARLNEATGLCPNCDAKKSMHRDERLSGILKEVRKNPKTGQRQDVPLSKKEAREKRKADKKAAKKERKAQKKAEKKEKWKKLSFGQKVRKFLVRLLLWMIMLAFFASVGCGVSVYYGLVKVPIIEEVLSIIGICSPAEFAGQDVNESYAPNTENIVYQNESNSLGYVNNMILVFFNSTASEKEIGDIVNSVNGTVVGRIAGINQYQIQIAPTEYDELILICNRLMENQSVNYAIIDTVITMDTNEIPNDPWKDRFQGLWGVDWDENNPDGYNWWIEAVKVPSAWDCDDAMTSINVGIVDNGFDTNHEDLNLVVLNNDVNNAENHGTHVAGVIGATINNEIGISGILKQNNLYCVDCYATSKQKKSNVAVSSLMDGIVTCLDNQCKVINMSSGIKFTSKDETAESAKESARYATIYLFAMLDSYDDFIIVQSAGNGNKAGIGVDAHKYNGYFASIDDEVIQSVLDEFEEKEVVLNRNITAEDVKNAYMIVGAVDSKKKKDNWQLSEFSNYGNSVTVCAPGVDVFSTIVTGGIDGNYGNMDGTSMAAPIVSGIAAMVWSVDPTMSSKQVQDYIADTATEIVLNRNKKDNGTYYLINAHEAVKQAISDLEKRGEVDQDNDTGDVPVRVTSDERDIVLVLDVSGSMSGTPMAETKKASVNFIDTILDEDASIGIVTYDNSASMLSDFSANEAALTSAVSGIYDGGMTNMDAGLSAARSMLQSSNAKKKIIVLMSDGLPNEGRVDDSLIAFADEIKNDGMLIYTLGFFEDLGSDKSTAQQLMEQLASEGCHYEVASADDLVFFFGDIADQINGTRYIYVRIACPVDVSVSYNGETLNSAKDDLSQRTEFGTLTYEKNENAAANSDDRIKILRLKEGVDYDIQIVGTGRGIMDYTIGFVDEEGEYSDLREFEDIKITKSTVIDTVAEVSDETVLRIDEDGDGRYDISYRAEKNGYGEVIRTSGLKFVVVGIFFAAILMMELVFFSRKRRRRKWAFGAA